MWTEAAVIFRGMGISLVQEFGHVDVRTVSWVSGGMSSVS